MTTTSYDVSSTRCPACAPPSPHYPATKPPRTRLTAGPFTFTVDPDEALTLADRFGDTYGDPRFGAPTRCGRVPPPGAVTGRRERLARPGVVAESLSAGVNTPFFAAERSYSWATGGGTPGSVVLG